MFSCCTRQSQIFIDLFDYIITDWSFNSYSTQLFNNYDLPVLNHYLSNPEEWLQKRATLLSARCKSQSRKQKQTNDITERTIEWQYFSKNVSNTSTHTHTPTYIPIIHLTLIELVIVSFNFNLLFAKVHFNLNLSSISSITYDFTSSASFYQHELYFLSFWFALRCQKE